LLLSPHPDDLVFSCFSVLAKPKGLHNRAIVFFNISTFSRWPIHSRRLVSTYRTLEDRFVLGSLHVEVKYLFGRDSSLESSSDTNDQLDWDLNLEIPSAIYSPLGVGHNENHLQVRDWAVKHWVRWQKKCSLLFYEDLPYAAKLGDTLEDKEVVITRELEAICGNIEFILEPLSGEDLARKLRFSKLYYSQTDYTDLLKSFAKQRGRSTETGFAEAFYRVMQKVPDALPVPHRSSALKKQ
jgi:hypothetical protein